MTTNKDQIDRFFEDRRDIRAGRRVAGDYRDKEPLKLISEEDLAYFEREFREDTEAELTATRAKGIAEIAEKDAQIAALNREIEERKTALRAQEKEIWRRAGDRAKLLEIVRQIAPGLAESGLSDDEIRSEAVRQKYGDEAVTNRSLDYVEARFDLMVSSSKIDPFARVVADGLRQSGDPKAAADQAYDEYVRSLTSSHRQTH